MTNYNKRKGNLNGLVTGEASKQLQEFKRKAGIVTKEEIRSLEPRTISDIEKKIELLDKYTIVQQRLVDLFGTLNGRVINSINQVMDLEIKLIELEETLKEQGQNPLLCPEWVKAREMLSRETQFIHKHKIDVAEVASRIQSRKAKRGEDVIFDIVVDEEEIKND